MTAHFIRLAFILLAAALPASAHGDDKPQWGVAAKTLRVPVDGMKTFYDPEAVKKDEEVVYFRMYSTRDPATREEGVEYSINCKTEEFSSKAGEWRKPVRVFPGEQMYPIGKKLCGWGSGIGTSLRKIFD